MIAFPPTHRSVLERLQTSDPAARQAAFGDLAEGYWRPTYHYLRLHWHLTPEAAEDIVQGFFTVAFEKRYLEKYDPAKAMFRTFLRTCVDRYVQNVMKADRAQKRGGSVEVLSLDFPGAEREVADLSTTNLADVDRFFHDEMIRALFSRTVTTLRAQLTAEHRDVVFRAFELHDLAPDAATSYATVAEALHLTVAQVTNYLHLARRRFRDLALGQLRGLCGTDEEFRMEARALFGVDVER